MQTTALVRRLTINSIVSQAVALAQACGVPISLCAMVSASLRGADVDVGLAAAIAAATSSGVPLGVRLAHAARPARLKLAIGLVLLGIGLYTLYMYSKVVVAWSQRRK